MKPKILINIVVQVKYTVCYKYHQLYDCPAVVEMLRRAGDLRWRVLRRNGCWSLLLGLPVVAAHSVLADVGERHGRKNLRFRQRTRPLGNFT